MLGSDRQKDAVDEGGSSTALLLLPKLLQGQCDILSKLESERMEHAAFKKSVVELLDLQRNEILTLQKQLQEAKAERQTLRQEQRDTRVYLEKLHQKLEKQHKEWIPQMTASLQQALLAAEEAKTKRDASDSAPPAWQQETIATDTLVMLSQSATAANETWVPPTPTTTQLIDIRAVLRPSNASLSLVSRRRQAERLWEAELASKNIADPNETFSNRLLACLRAGADPTYQAPGLQGSVLHCLAARGAVAGWVGVMKYYEPELVLTAADSCGRTPLHVLVSVCPSSLAAKRMLAALVDRITRAAPTRIDWAQTCPVAFPFASVSPSHAEGVSSLGDLLPQDETQREKKSLPSPRVLYLYDVLNSAALHHRLSIFWEAVKNVPYYRNLPEGSVALRVPLKVLHAQGWQQYLSRLSEKDQLKFLTFGNATEMLGRISEMTYWRPNVETIARCLRMGADPLSASSTPHLSGKPLLAYYVEYGALEAVKALLEPTERENPEMNGSSSHLPPLALDFTTRDAEGCTVLHWISVGTREGVLSAFGLKFSKTSVEVAGLLNAFLDRLKKTAALGAATGSDENPDSWDKVDWGQKDPDGDDCLAWAAHSGFLATWWRIVIQREVPFYVQHPRPIPLTAKVKRSGWDELTPQEKNNFTIVQGFQ